jgi:hypothetical protein
VPRWVGGRRCGRTFHPQLHRARKAKVGQHGLQLSSHAADEHVPQGNVAVDYVLAVQVRQAGRDVDEEPHLDQHVAQLPLLLVLQGAARGTILVSGKPTR